MGIESYAVNHIWLPYMIPIYGYLIHIWSTTYDVFTIYDSYIWFLIHIWSTTYDVPTIYEYYIWLFDPYMVNHIWCFYHIWFLYMVFWSIYGQPHTMFLPYMITIYGCLYTPVPYMVTHICLPYMVVNCYDMCPPTYGLPYMNTHIWSSTYDQLYTVQLGCTM